MSCPFAKHDDQPLVHFPAEVISLSKSDFKVPDGHNPMLYRSLPFEPLDPSKQPQDEMWKELAGIIALGHEKLIEGSTRWFTLNLMMDRLVKFLDLEYGFMCRYEYNTEEPFEKHLKGISYTNIAWTPELQKLVSTTQELNFSLEGSGLFAEPIRTGRLVLTNDPQSHPCYKGIPDGHPPLSNFLGVPLWLGSELMGTVGLANRDGGWTLQVARIVEAFGSMLGSLMLLFETQLRLAPGDDLDADAEIDYDAEIDGGSSGSHHAGVHYTSDLTVSHLTPQAIGEDAEPLVAPVAALTINSNRNGGDVDGSAPVAGEAGHGHGHGGTPVSTSSSPMGSDPGALGEIHRARSDASSMASQYKRHRNFIDEAMIQVSMADAISDGVVIFDAKTRICTCNSGAAKMLGFNSGKQLSATYPTFSELLAPVLADQNGKGFSTVPADGIPEDREDPHLDISSILNMSKHMANGVYLEASLRRKPKSVMDLDSDKSFNQVDLSITTFMYAGRLHYTAVFRDIGQEKMFKRKDTLLAFLSHEIRNPLQAIISGSQLQMEQHPSSNTEDIHRAANILYSVVNDTIDFVRINAQKFEPQESTFGIGETINLCQRIYGAGCSADVTWAEPIVCKQLAKVVCADERRFMQVLGNLLSNAVKHTAAGEIQVRVDSLPPPQTPSRRSSDDSANEQARGDGDGPPARPFDGQIVVYVSDNGVGIPEEDQARLFEFFTQLLQNPNAKRETSGLGLLLSREITRALGGDLWLESSTPGQGACFAFRMPYRHARMSRESDGGASVASTGSAGSAGGAGGEAGVGAAAAAAMLLAGGEMAVPTKDPLQGLRVLVVDDNRLVSTVIQKILVGSACITTLAEDGLEALARLEGEGAAQYDVVLMDCLMPKCDGYEAVRVLRSRGYNRPVIAITGNSLQEDVTRAHEAGYDDVMLKPVKNKDLIRKVLSWVGKTTAKEVGAAPVGA